MTERDFKSNSALHNDLIEVKSVSDMSRVSGLDKVCRICFENSNDSINPLVSLCKCSGTVKYIHF